MLNDLSRQTRIIVFFQVLGPGLVSGSLFAVAKEAWTLTIVLVAVGLVATFGWCVGVLVWNRRLDRAFKTMLVHAGEQIVTGQVIGIPAIGRVHRRRIARRDPSHLADQARLLPGPSVVLVVTALTADGARRVGALVPAMIGLESRKAPVALLLHPDDREAAVLDNRVSRAQVAAIAQDPRWHTERLPSDRSVVGGYLPLIAVSVLGLLTAVGFDLLVVAFAT